MFCHTSVIPAAALQARAFDHSATCPKWCNGPKRNALARQAKVRRLGGVAMGVAIVGDTQCSPIGQRGAHGGGVGRVITLQDRLGVLPPSQIA